jgi:hypothetical protein
VARLNVAQQVQNIDLWMKEEINSHQGVPGDDVALKLTDADALHQKTTMNLIGTGSYTSCRYVFIVHVGRTRCVTSSTDQIMKTHACITLGVEFIRACILYFYFMFEYKYSMITTNVLTYYFSI